MSANFLETCVNVILIPTFKSCCGTGCLYASSILIQITRKYQSYQSKLFLQSYKVIHFYAFYQGCFILYPCACFYGNLFRKKSFNGIFNCQLEPKYGLFPKSSKEKSAGSSGYDVFYFLVLLFSLLKAFNCSQYFKAIDMFLNISWTIHYTMTFQKITKYIRKMCDMYLHEQMHLGIATSYFSLFKTSDKYSSKMAGELSLLCGWVNLTLFALQVLRGSAKPRHIPCIF